MNKNIALYFFVCLLCFVGIKFSIWPLAFVYPFFIYKILVESDTWKGIFWVSLLGLIFSLSLYLWGTTTALSINAYSALFGLIIFGFSALIFQIYNKMYLYKFPRFKPYSFLLIPASFFVAEWILFTFLFGDAVHIFSVPILLPFLYHYIGISGVHALIWGISITTGILFLKSSTKYLKALCFLPVLVIIIIHLVFPLLFPVNQTIPIALIQGNITEEITWKRDHSDELFFLYKNKITKAAQNGAKIVFLPENPFLFWTSPLDTQSTLDELALLSKKLDVYIMFATLQQDKNQNHIASFAYIIDPELGVRDPYHAQHTYDNIAQSKTFSVGIETKTYKTKYGTFRLLVCFEALFRKNLKKSDSVDYDHLVIFGNNQFLPSHRAFDILQWNTQDLAGTYKKDVIYTSNSGPTAHTNKWGYIEKTIPYDTEDILWSSIESL